MRRLVLALALVALASCASTTTPRRHLDAERLSRIDAEVRAAIAAQKLPGGVLWVEREGEVWQCAYGNRAIEPRIEPMTADTIFDAASITKVVATSPSIWLLIERGKVALDEPVKTYLPEMASASITVRHLLTHTSGLPPGLDLRDEWSGYDEGVRRATSETPRNRPGAVFRYSDINFILLGEIVHRVSGMPLDAFAKRELFDPLGMKDTRFRSLASTNPARIAPTEHGLRGVVHDPTTRRMGGVAGQAGLFTTVSDVAKYARAVLAGGAGVLRPETVRAMTSLQSPDGVAVRRAGGWDLDSSFSRPRGEHFPIGSFGHTGWTGGFLWIDPFSRTFYVFLSNRVHPDGKGSVLALQKRVGTLVAEGVRDFDFSRVDGALPMRAGGGVGWVTGGADAQNGIDVLHANGYAELRGLRVGLITNQTGIDRAGNPTIDLLRSAPGVELASLFTPEHGIRGALDAKVADDVDRVTGLPIHSLYGERRKPSAEQLRALDALVFDVQDIGTRFYTYISTLMLAMEAASDAGIRFVVLDRVNPIGGEIVEGPVMEGAPEFVGIHPIPIRHGLTVGELARLFRLEKRMPLDLQVVPVRGWKREQWQDEAGLPWINTSPNMRSLRAAALYPGIGLLESALSVGRGTSTPFELIGAPYIDGDTLARELNAAQLPGLRFEAVRFTPTASIHANEPCGGVRITITDRRSLRSLDAGIVIAQTLVRLHPQQFDATKLAPLLRHAATLQAITTQQPLAAIHESWRADLEVFSARRRAVIEP